MPDSVRPDEWTRPGLPTEAARIAQGMHRPLPRNHELLDAHAATGHLPTEADLTALRARLGADPAAAATLDAVLAEVDRLRRLEAQHLTLLAEAAHIEAAWFDQDLKRPLVRLADDCYIAWVGGCDAPTGWTMTRAEVEQRGWPEHRIADAATPDPDGTLLNRAGPGEKPLTVAAMIEAYANEQAYTGFRLTPAKVACWITSDIRQEDGVWKESEPYWTPWRPEDTPPVLPDGWRETFR